MGCQSRHMLSVSILWCLLIIIIVLFRYISFILKVMCFLLEFLVLLKFKFLLVLRLQDLIIKGIYVQWFSILFTNEGYSLSMFLSTFLNIMRLWSVRISHLLDVIRTLLIDSSVPSRFWVKELSMAVYMIDRVPF
jgi:hypothetical protein